MFGLKLVTAVIAVAQGAEGVKFLTKSYILVLFFERMAIQLVFLLGSPL